MLKIDDLFSISDKNAANQLADDLQSESTVCDKEWTLMIDIACDIQMSIRNASSLVNMLREYVHDAAENIKLTISTSRSAELVKTGLELVTYHQESFEAIRDEFSDDVIPVYDPNSGGFASVYFRIDIYEDFRCPVQLMRFISELFENTRNKQHYSRNEHRDMMICKRDDHPGISVQNIDFKELITEERHEKHKRHLRFSEREAFRQISHVCQYVMLGRKTGVEIYTNARYKFKRNLDIELMTAAHSAIVHDKVEDNPLNLSCISDIEGFSFLFARIKILDLCWKCLVWWKTAAFVFYNTYKISGYEVFDFDASGHRTEHAMDLYDECNQFNEFEFGIKSIFQAGFMWDRLEDNLYFAMVIKLGTVSTGKVNDGGAYETAFIYKERIKEPDVQLTVVKFCNFICDSLNSEYVDDKFRRDVRFLLEKDFNKTFNEFKHR